MREKRRWWEDERKREQYRERKIFPSRKGYQFLYPIMKSDIIRMGKNNGKKQKVRSAKGKRERREE